MKSVDIVAQVENAVRDIQYEKLDYFDFLGLLSDRLAVLFVALNQIAQPQLGNLSISRDTYALTLVAMVCDELVAMHHQICALLDSHDDAESGGDDCDSECGGL